MNVMRVIDDLLWALSSPSLLRNRTGDDVILTDLWCRDAEGKDRDLIQNLHSNQYFQTLLTDFSLDEMRLGIYFEHLILIWFKCSPRFKLLAYNLPVRRNALTLGAFDFIVYDYTIEKTLHIETAVKFYLLTQPSEELSAWCGPDGHDNFQAKYDHLLNKQIRLSEQRGVTSWLKKQNINIDQHHIFIKGRLFAHNSLKHVVSPLINPALNIDRVFFFNEFIDLFFSSKGFFTILPKEKWLSTLKLNAAEPIQVLNMQKKKPQPWDLPVCLAYLSTDYIEVFRCFVVPDTWP